MTNLFCILSFILERLSTCPASNFEKLVNLCLCHSLSHVLWPFATSLITSIQLLHRLQLFRLFMEISQMMGKRRGYMQEEESRMGQRRGSLTPAARWKLRGGYRPVCTTASLPASILSPVRTQPKTSPTATYCTVFYCTVESSFHNPLRNVWQTPTVLSDCSHFSAIQNNRFWPILLWQIHWAL